MARALRLLQFSLLTLLCLPLVAGVFLALQEVFGFDRAAGFVQQAVTSGFILTVVFVNLKRWREARSEDE